MNPGDVIQFIGKNNPQNPNAGRRVWTVLEHIHDQNHRFYGDQPEWLAYDRDSHKPISFKFSEWSIDRQLMPGSLVKGTRVKAKSSVADSYLWDMSTISQTPWTTRDIGIYMGQLLSHEKPDALEKTPFHKVMVGGKIYGIPCSGGMFIEPVE